MILEWSGVTYVGLVVPCLVLLAVAAAVGVAWKWGLWFWIAPTCVLILLLVAAASLNRISDEAGYVLPWHLPKTVHLHQRNYLRDGCERKRLAGVMTRAGWVYGYFATSRPLYISRRDAEFRYTPTLLYVGGGSGRCVPVYALSGGP